jgi:hypothetical protein
MLGSIAVGAGRQYAPAAPIGRFRAAPQLIRSACRMRTRTFVVGLLMWTGAPLCASATDHPAIKPGQVFSNPIVQIRAPTSEGWFGISQDAYRIAFGKSGAERDESYVATVILFRIPDFADTDEFTNFAKQEIEKDSPTSRFDVLESVVQYSAERSYPCVKHHGTALDKKSAVFGFHRKPLRLEVVSLYCQHPYRPNLGFMVSFSHRGGGEDPYFAGDAEKFINGVQATSMTPEPAPRP